MDYVLGLLLGNTSLLDLNPKSKVVEDIYKSISRYDWNVTGKNIKYSVKQPVMAVDKLRYIIIIVE